MPQPVKDAIATHHEGAVIEEAWEQEEDSGRKYKLLVSQNSEFTYIFVDEKGNLMEDQ